MRVGGEGRTVPLLLLIVATLLGAGTAAQPGEDARAAPTAVWTFAWAGATDRARYQLENGSAGFAFRFAGASEHWTPGGAVRVDWLERSTMPGLSAGESIRHRFGFSSSNGSLVAAGREQAVPPSPSAAQPLGPNPWSIDRDLSFHASVRDLNELPPCGVRHLLQGRTVRMAGELRFSGPCALGTHRFAGLILHVEPVEPGAPVRWLSGSMPTIDGDAATVRVRLDLASPVPTMIWVQAAKAAPQTWVLDAAVEAVHEPGRALVPWLGERTAWRPWGPDEGGIRHPFPLSAALRQAREHPVDRSIADFERTHPGAYLRRAEYEQVRTPLVLEHRWHLEVTDGAERAAQCVTRSNVTSPERPCAPARTWREPAAAKPPHEIFTVETAWSAWKMARGPRFAEEAPNAWGFEIRCAASGCQEPEVRMHAGRTTREESSLGANQTLSRLELSETHATGLRELYAVAGPVSGGPGPDPAAVRRPIEPGALTIDEIRQNAPSENRSAAWAASGGLLLLLLAARPWLRELLFLVLATRVERSEALKHPVRSGLVALIEQRPGVHLHEIQRALGLSRSQAQYHLAVLRRHGLLQEVRGHGHVVFFRTGAVDRRLMHAAATTKAGAARRILALLDQRPGTPLADVAVATSLAIGTVHYHVRRLHGAGLVEFNGPRPNQGARLTKVGQAALTLWGPGSPSKGPPITP